MINFNKININILSFIISSIIFFIIISIINFPNNNLISNTNNQNNNLIKQNIIISNAVKENEITVNEIQAWSLEIDSLNLEANIAEMEEDNPESEFINHFKQTTILGNNIALFAYNYGKKYNHFANLKELKVKERVKYIVNNEEKVYEVISNKIIEKESLNNILNDNNYDVGHLKLFTYVKDINDKLRFVDCKEIIDI